MTRSLQTILVALALGAQLSVCPQEMMTAKRDHFQYLYNGLTDREAVIRRCVEQLHREAYDSVFATTAFLRERNPEDPAGYFLAADACNTLMRDYRVRRFETQFDSLISLTIAVTETALKRHPTAENYFLLGSAEGYRCLHLFRRGKWLTAIGSALNSVRNLRRAQDLEPDFVDPLLGLALYDFGKSKVPALGWFVSRETILRRLERVQREGRYVSVSARYALQVVYMEMGQTDRAWEVNNWLYERFPRNPVCLYNRALLLEKLNRPQEAALVWEQLIARVEDIERPSKGYLAECYYHLSSLSHLAGETEQEASQLAAANRFVKLYRPEEEMDGPYTSFDETKKAISQATKKVNRTQEVAQK